MAHETRKKGGGGQRTVSPPGIPALRQGVSALLADLNVVTGLSPGFFFQRCLPIWKPGLDGTIDKAKAHALSALDPAPADGSARVMGDPDLHRALSQRRAATFQALRRGFCGVELILRNIAPFVTGIGQPHPLENGFAFLRPYGIPYLAGSGIKGAVRAACTAVWKETRKAEAATLLQHYFGSRDKDHPEADHQEGALVFFDLWPEVQDWKDVFRLDLVNPHYDPYYKGKDVPADWHNPIPSLFLTLRSDLSWRLRILYTPRDPGARRATWADDLALGVERALTVEGLGAKKSWGYGLFMIEGADPITAPWSGLVQSGKAAGQHGDAPRSDQPPVTPLDVGLHGGTQPNVVQETKRSAQAAAVEGVIKILKAHEVSGRLQAIVADIRRCPDDDRPPLYQLLRVRVEALIEKKKDIQRLLGPYPEMRGPAGS